MTSTKEINAQTAVIFDWSGTLSDNFHLFCKVVERIFDDHGKEHILVEEVQRTFTLPYMKFWSYHLPELTKEKQDQLYTKYIHEVGEPELFKGVAGMMESLHQAGVQLFILSSDPITKLQPEIDKSGFGEYIVEVTGNVHEKDEVIERYITDHDLGTHRVFYVGDTSGDVEAGRSAGVQTIAVTWGFQHNDALAQSNPDFLVSTVPELQSVIL